jgi:hypothetical protein
MRLSTRLILTLAAAAFSGPAFAQDSAKDASGASGAASQAVGLLAASGVKTVVGVAAIPVSVAAIGASGAGAVSATAGHVGLASGANLSQAAGASADASLKVDDRVVVAPDPAPKVPYQAQTAAAPK